MNMFDLFGRNSKSLKELMDELNEMIGGYDSPLTFKGETKTENGSDSNGDWTKQTYTSKDGFYKITTYIKTYDGSDKRKENKPTSKIESLKKELDIAVKNEDFLLAIKLRDTIKDLEENEGLINELQEKLKSHIEKQEFEEAIKVRDELKKYE